MPLNARPLAELVEDDEVHAGEVVDHSTLTTPSAFGLELVDPVDDVEEAAARTDSDSGPGDGDGQMGLAGAGPADQDGVALMGDEVAAGEIPHQRLVDRRIVEDKIVDVPSQRQLGRDPMRSGSHGNPSMAIWYLIDRACFSEISAVRRSSTTRCGSCWRSTAVARISSKAAFMPYSFSSPMVARISDRSITLPS